MNRCGQEGWPIEVAVPDGDGWEFLVDDELLPISTQGFWSWSPGFYAGLVSAELRKRGNHAAFYRLEVSPDPSKLTETLYQTMLDDLVEIDPLLTVGTEPASHQLGTLGSSSDLWMEFRRLRMHAPAFVAALRQLTNQPIRTVRASRRMAPLRAARRVDLQTVRAAAMVGALGPLFASVDPLAAPEKQSDPAYDLPWFEEHLDGPANRAITAMLVAVRRRALQLIERLNQEVNRTEDSATRTDLSTRWAVRRNFLAELINQLRHLMRAEPFRSVSRPEISAAGLNAISAHPVYARSYRCGWYAVRPGLHGVDLTESIWLCPTWELYERWCFGEVVRQLRSLTGQQGKLEWEPSRGILKCNASSGMHIEALFQRVFTASENAEFRSVSRKRRPDIVVTAELQGDRRYIVLDPKYTQNRSGVLASMASAHIYNDSLRWRGERPCKALLLLPAGGGAPWLEADELIRAERVGALVLSPEDGSDKLSHQLRALLSF